MSDFLSECLEGSGLNIQEFQQGFCRACGNTGCARAVFQQTRWQQRMTRQLQMLEGPNLAAPNDPLWEVVRRIGHFQTLLPDVIEVGTSATHLLADETWMLPSAAVDQAVAALRQTESLPAPELPAPVESLSVESLPAVAAPPTTAPAPAETTPQPPAAAPSAYNTPNPGRIMIGTPRPAPAAATTSTAREIRIKPGGTVKLG